MLADLGLREAHSFKYLKSVNRYLAAEYSSSMLEDLFKLMGLENDARIKKYLAAADSFSKNRLLKKIFYLHFRKNRTFEKIVQMTGDGLPEEIMG